MEELPKNLQEYGLPRDTDLEALRAYYAHLARLSPEERLRQGFRLCERGRKLMEIGVRQRHPDYDDETVRLAVIRMRIGEECFRQFFPGVEAEP